jgi:hypothetical protein
MREIIKFEEFTTAFVKTSESGIQIMEAIEVTKVVVTESVTFIYYNEGIAQYPTSSVRIYYQPTKY